MRRISLMNAFLCALHNRLCRCISRSVGAKDLGYFVKKVRVNVCLSWCCYWIIIDMTGLLHDTRLLYLRVNRGSASALSFSYEPSARFHLKTPPSDGGRDTMLVAPRRWKKWNHPSFLLSAIVPISRYSLWNGWSLAVTCVFGSIADAHS
jgi:hypothetical protein